MKYKVIKAHSGLVSMDEYGEGIATINHSYGKDFPMIVVENDIIQSLKNGFEMEMEWDCRLKDCVKQNTNCVLPNNGVCKAKKIIKTDRVGGQLMAYIELNHKIKSHVEEH